MAKSSGTSKTKRQPKQPEAERQVSNTPDRLVVIKREPIEQAGEIENRTITDGEWDRDHEALTADGWYREGDAPIVNPNRPLSILRNNLDGTPPQQRVIKHGDWVANHASYQGEGWYRADEARSASRPTGS